MKIAYNKVTGKIIRQIPNDQDPLIFFINYPETLKKNMVFLEVSETYLDLHNYRIFDNKLARISDQEMAEIRVYGRALSAEERVLEQMKPSEEEIKEAEQTVQLLNLLQEVL